MNFIEDIPDEYLTMKDPEAKIETWFNEPRLEMFAASFEKVPLLWHVQHIDCDGIAPNSAEYMFLLDSLGEPCAGERRARVSCAKALCRVFCRLLRQRLRWAATKSLLDGTGEERALGMLPYWARQAERYMHYLPLIYLNTQQELKTKAEKAIRAQRNKEKRAQQQKSLPKEPSKNTEKQDLRTRNPSSSSRGNIGNSGNNKGSRPPPVPAPIAPKHKPSQYAEGRKLMLRVACGMRRAAKIHGLGRKAAAVVAGEIGNQAAQVHALWSSMRVLARAKLKALLARGDGRANTESAHMTCLDWAVADLMMMYEFSPVQESSFLEEKEQRALAATFQLVQRFQLEAAGQDLPPHKWHEAARLYCKTGCVMSPVGLQRRWHELKERTQRALRGRIAGDSAPEHPLHRVIAKKYPHVVTARLRPWSELLTADLVARPTNERGSKKPLDLLVRPGPSKSVRIIDHSLPQANSGSEVSSEENSNHFHTNEVKRHSENTRTEGYQKNIDLNKEIIDLDAPSAESEELKRLQGLNDGTASNIDTEVVKEEDFKNNVDVNRQIIDLDVPSAEYDELKKLQEFDDISSSVVKLDDVKNNVDVNKEIIDLDAPSAESEELKRLQGFDDRTNSNIVQTNEVKNRRNENTRGEGYNKNIDVNKEIIDLDAPSAEPNELERRQMLDDINASDKVKEVVEGRIRSKTNNAPNSDDFATQVIRAIEKEIFYKGSLKFSKKCNTKPNCENVSNSKIKPSSKEINNDGIEKVTSSSQINTNYSNSSVADATHKHPMLTQMLQTVCIFDDDAGLNTFLNRNKEVYRKGKTSNTDVTSNTNDHENEIKSLVENKTRKRVRAKLTDDWAQDIVRAIKRQRLESAKLENPQINNNLIEEESSRGNVNKSNKKSRSSVSAMKRKTKSKDTEYSKSITNLNSDDELYFFNVSSDEEDASQNSEVREHSIDPKLLIYPVVVMTRIENDPSLRIVPKLPPLPASRSPSPNLSSLILESPSLPDIKLESPSPSNIKLEKLDDKGSGAEDTPLFVTTPTPEILNEKSRALLKLCKPCKVVLERLEEVDKGIGRLAKRVELQDIDEVRRHNRRVLTAQVAPLAQDSESSSSDSRDSDWTPEMGTTRKRTANENSDSISDSDSETDNNVDNDNDSDDDDNGDDETIKPTKAKDLQNTDDHLKQLLNDFVDGPDDAECCRRNKRTRLRGELAATASLAMKRNCARCLWQLLSAPPASAGEARLQRRLLRHTVLQATSTAPKDTKIPKQIPSETKQVPKQKASPRSEKESLPASPASQPATDVAPMKPHQRVASASDRPLPAHSPPRRTNTAKQRLALKPPAGPSTAPKNPELRSSSSLFRPGVVADINEKLGKLVEKQPPQAPGAFDPIITSVLSLAPPQPKNKKCPLVPEKNKLLQSVQAPTARNVVEKPPATKDVRKTDSVATSLNVPKPSLNYVAIPSNTQTRFNTLQPCNTAQSHSSQSAQFKRDALQPQMNLSTPQHLPGTTHLPPAVQTVVGQMGSQNFALQGTANVMLDPNTVVGNVMQAPGFQNAPWNNQGNCLVKQETSAFQPVIPINANQPNSMYIQPNQPNPMYIQPNQLNPMQINQNQPNPMYMHPNQSNPIHINQNQSIPMYIQPNQSKPMQINQNQSNPMYIPPNQPNPMQINQNQPNPIYIQPNHPNPMYIQPNQLNPMSIQPNQPNPMLINQNQPNPMYIQSNQPNPMYINPNQTESMNIQTNQPNLIRPNPMYINPNQSNAIQLNPNQPDPIYPKQMYVNQNQPNPMHINPNQPNPVHRAPMHQSNPMYIDQNQLNLMNPTQINQPIMCPSTIPIKTEQGSSYLPPISHPNPYGMDTGYSPTIPMLGNPTLTGISQPNAFNPMNAGSLQNVFNSMQEPTQSQSYQRLPSYDEAVAALAGSQQLQQNPSQFEDSKPTMLAVDVKIGYCDSGNELYDKLNSYTRLKWYAGRPQPSHEWVAAAAGRSGSGLAVLCTGAYRNPWALLGAYLVVSEEEPPPPNFDVWALNPRVRLRLPHEKEDSATDASAVKPARLQVKSFARTGPAEVEKGRPGRHAYAKVKLSDNPPVYAKLLVSVPNANSCRQLLKRGGAIQLYDIQTCLLYPILSQPTGADSQFSLSGEAPVFPALQELARQLQDNSH